MDPVKTRFLIISDTHGKDVPLARTIREIDVVIHCGDLTKESSIEEYNASLELLSEIQAPVKIVVPGNRDSTLDMAASEGKTRTRSLPIDPSQPTDIPGNYSKAKEILRKLEDKGVSVLYDEGVYEFSLFNGTLVTIYASPYTPSEQDRGGFQYAPLLHRFNIPSSTDVVITHGPPKGILDSRNPASTPENQVGCPELFHAVALAQPKLHCFGHVREHWGAERITWKPQDAFKLTRENSVNPLLSGVVNSLAEMEITTKDLKNPDQTKVEKRKQCERQGFVMASVRSPAGVRNRLRQTLFVNAAIEGKTSAGRDMPRHLPWVVEMELPKRVPGYCANGVVKKVERVLLSR